MAELTVRESLWKEFVHVGKKMGKKPETLAERAMRDFLERLADEELLARSERAARKARFDIRKTEAIIRDYRKKNARA